MKPVLIESRTLDAQMAKEILIGLAETAVPFDRALRALEVRIALERIAKGEQVVVDKPAEQPPA